MRKTKVTDKLNRNLIYNIGGGTSGRVPGKLSQRKSS